MNTVSKLVCGSVVAAWFASGSVLAADVRWDLVPFTQGSPTLSVLIDTTQLKSNEVVNDLSLSARFNDAKGSVLQTKTLLLLQKGQVLGAGAVYQINVQHGVARAVSVDLGEFAAWTNVSGGKADGPDERAKPTKADVKRVSIQAAATRSLGEVVPATSVDGSAKNPLRPMVIAPTGMTPTQRCSLYADLAVITVGLAQRHQCGFPSDARWHTVKQRHYDWCLNMPGSSLEEETNARTHALLKLCKSGSKP